MKDKEKKHHKGESVIGKIIYGFLLFMPLLAIGTTIAVNLFNNTEQKKTTIVYKYETNEVHETEDLKIGNIYHLNFDDTTLDNYFNPIQFENNGDYIICDYINVKVFDFTFYDPFLDEYTNGETEGQYLNQFTINSYLDIGFYTPNGYNGYFAVYYENLTEYPIKFECDIIIVDYQLTSNVFYIEEIITKCENIPIEGVETYEINRNDTFNYAIKQVEENNLFNWSKNSIIYTGIYEFTQALNVTNTLIPMLLTYWLLISVIYFLYDIVLMLVLIIHNKIHCLQDSI